MKNKIRQIIREEIYRVMQEIGEEDPVKLAQNIVKSNEEQVQSLRDELRFRQADARVSNLPREERKAREERMKTVQGRLEAAEAELEMAKQSEISAVQLQQLQQSQATQEPAGQTQVQPQV